MGRQAIQCSARSHPAAAAAWLQRAPSPAAAALPKRPAAEKSATWISRDRSEHAAIVVERERFFESCAAGMDSFDLILYVGKMENYCNTVYIVIR